MTRGLPLVAGLVIMLAAIDVYYSYSHGEANECQSILTP